jgi:hypothetical protein
MRYKLAGNPTAAETDTFTIQATSADTTVSQAYWLTITPKRVCQLTPGHTPNDTLPDTLSAGMVNGAYSQNFTTSVGCGVITTWQVLSGRVPPGLTQSGPVLSGTPTTAGTYNFTLAAGNGSVSTTQAYAIIIADNSNSSCFLTPPGSNTATPYALNSGTVGSVYFANLTWSAGCGSTGGADSIYKGSGTLPPGIKFYSDGSFHGTPTTAVTDTFTITIHGDSGSTSQQYIIQVK